MGPITNRYNKNICLLYIFLFPIFIISCKANISPEENIFSPTLSLPSQTPLQSPIHEIIATTSINQPDVDEKNNTRIDDGLDTILFIPNFNASSLNKFKPQPGTPVAMVNFAHPELGCDWLGVGGQFFDYSGVPIQNFIIEVGGSIEGNDIFLLGITGSASWIGPGGYEFKILDYAASSDETLWIQAFDLSGEPMTSKVKFNTYSDCNRNFILINFIESEYYFEQIYYLPLIFSH